MESAFTMCPACETMLKGDEAECPNCGTAFDLSPEPVPPESPGVTTGAGVPPVLAPPPYEYVVVKAVSEDHLTEILNGAARAGWEPFSTYFGWRVDEESSVYFVVLRRRIPSPLEPS